MKLKWNVPIVMIIIVWDGHSGGRGTAALEAQKAIRQMRL